MKNIFLNFKASSSKRSSLQSIACRGALRSLSSPNDSGRRRITFTVEQLKILEDTFKRSPFVSGEERSQLAATLQQPEERVRRLTRHLPYRRLSHGPPKHCFMEGNTGNVGAFLWKIHQILFYSAKNQYF